MINDKQAKVVGVLQPFDKRQSFYVYENGNKIATATPKFEEISDTIFALTEQYNITKVDLIGPSQYIRGLIKQVKQAEMQKYNHNKLDINPA